MKTRALRSFAGISILCVGVASGCRDANPDQTLGERRAAMATPDTLERIIATARDAASQGQTEKAEAVLREAAETYPHDQAIRLAYGDLLFRLERREAALRQYEAALEIGPPIARVLFQAGMAARLTGDEQVARERLTRAARTDPTHVDAALQAAIALLDAGELERAAAHAQRATLLDDGRATAWGTLAEIELRRGDAEAALKAARNAREIEPGQEAWEIIERRARRKISQSQ